MIQHENKLTCPLNSSYLSSSITQQSPNLVPENREFTVNIAIRNKPVQPAVHFLYYWSNLQYAIYITGPTCSTPFYFTGPTCSTLFILLVQSAVRCLYNWSNLQYTFLLYWSNLQYTFLLYWSNLQYTFYITGPICSTLFILLVQPAVQFLYYWSNLQYIVYITGPTCSCTF